MLRIMRLLQSSSHTQAQQERALSTEVPKINIPVWKVSIQYETKHNKQTEHKVCFTCSFGPFFFFLSFSHRCHSFFRKTYRNKHKKKWYVYPIENVALIKRKTTILQSISFTLLTLTKRKHACKVSRRIRRVLQEISIFPVCCLLVADFSVKIFLLKQHSIYIFLTVWCLRCWFLYLLTCCKYAPSK